MAQIPVIVVFDIGKTNKKIFIFSENYKIVFRQSVTLPETTDEDGDACEDIMALKKWIFDSISSINKEGMFEIRAINFSAYGASFVYVDENGESLTPIYNYLKSYPAQLKDQFYNKYGGEKQFAKETASPVLDSLNSGMQLYRIKKEKPELFKKIKYALHLPQYLSFLITKQFYSDITSIGCHTNLWDFEAQKYHQWLLQEDTLDKLPPIVQSDSVLTATYNDVTYNVGVGLHDSSASLIPYLVSFNEPFILISTGTWCISLNPFNQILPTDEELAQDCLCYIQYQGQSVKASRLFAGFEHEQQLKRIALHFNQNPAHIKLVDFNQRIFDKLSNLNNDENLNSTGKIPFSDRDLSSFSTESEAYHLLMLDLATAQYEATQLVMRGSEVKKIFVDGGFSKNSIYMNLLARFFPDIEVYASSMAQATAVGTALAIHKHWNNKEIQNDIISLKHYPVTTDVSF